MLDDTTVKLEGSLQEFGHVQSIWGHSLVSVTKANKTVVVSLKYSRQYREHGQFKYWWTFNSNVPTKVDWVFFICQGLDGVFVMAGDELRVSGKKWHANLRTDMTSFFRFSGPGLPFKDGTPRLIATQNVNAFLSDFLSDPQAWNLKRTDRNPSAVSESTKASYHVSPQASKEDYRHLAVLIHNLVHSESTAMEHLKQYVSGKGFVYDDELLVRFHVSLKTKPLVILSGLSGSGKSKLPQLYGQAFGAVVESFPVSPSWNSDADLLGYYNPIHKEYVTTQLFDLLKSAEKDPNRLYICVLDEMNLARVEHYFAQFLSVLEQSPENQEIRVQGGSVSVQLGNNVRFIGTVNTDDSVYPFSDKVLDRANVVEFGFVDITRRPEPKPVFTRRITTPQFFSWRKITTDENIRGLLGRLNGHLKETDMHFGFRVANDVEAWVSNASGLLSITDALDLQIQQRILPKVRGPVEEPVTNLLTILDGFFEKHQLRRCRETVFKKKEQAKRGYIQ